MRICQPFRFKKFQIHQDKTAMKVGTDGVLLGAWTDISEAENILDIGTGTGLIALMMAQKNEVVKIDAVEIDESSYEQATQNFEESPWNRRLSVFQASIQDYTENCEKQYDLIISNPPYFVNSTKSKFNHKNQVRHTDSLSFEELIKAVNFLLKPSGRFCVVLPFAEGEIFEILAKAEKLYCTKKVSVKGRDFKPTERLLMQFEKQEKAIEERHLVIQNSPKRHDYTSDYINLTKDFYLFM
jgi:tRNA1Val (adenine37-N6)-methyltransferase